MNCPMKLPVYEAGAQRCLLSVEREGLYLHFSCRCDLSGGGMRRVYAVCGMQVEPLGLLMPQQGSFVLQAKRSVHSFPLDTIDTALIGRAPEPELLPWRGQIEGIPVETAWLRPTQEGYELYIPRDIPFPLPELSALAEPAAPGQIPCLRLLLDPEGNPVRPIAPEE